MKAYRMQPCIFGANKPGQGRLMPDSDTSHNGWTSADKFAAVMETAAMNQTQIAAYCRERGIFAEHLADWRQACEQANDCNQASEKKLKEATAIERKKNKVLQKELDRKEKALAEAAALLVLRKKFNAMFEEPEDD